MLIALLTLAAVGHVVLWVALVNRLHGLGVRRELVNLGTASCGLALVVLLPAAVAVIWLVRPGVTSGSWSFAWATAWSYVAGCCVVAVAATLERLWQTWHSERCGVLVQNNTKCVDLRKTGRAQLTAPGIPALLSRLPGNEALSIHLQEKHLAIPRLPQAHDGVRIVHLSDLHMSGRVGKAFFIEAVEQANALEPDLVAVTGDLVENARCLDWIPDTLGRLRAPAGVYYVRGNHDRHVDQPRLIAALAEAGLTHIGGRWQQVSVRDTPVVLTGNELPWYPPAPSLNGCPSRDAAGLPLRILLSHTPDQFDWAQSHDIDLMLAGHCHGGQVQLPILGSVLVPSLFGTRYACGVFRAGPTVMHVSRGTSSLTPLRWNCPPEIALLVLRSA